MADIREGLGRKLWWDLARRDLRDRYHGAILGVAWVVVTTACLSGGLALVYSQVFSVDMKEFLPYVCAGISVWSFISGLLNDSTQVFTSSSSYFKQMALPTSVFVYRMVVRNICFAMLRILVVVAVLLSLGHSFSLVHLQSILGMLVLAIWGTGLGFLFGPISARFRDLAQAIVAGTTFAFFVTPVFWYPEKLRDYAWVLEWNPLYHLLETVRQPLLGVEVWPYLEFSGPIAVSTLVLGVSIYSVTKSKLYYWC